MPRILLAALAALILILPATAEGQSGLRLRGTVALKAPAQGLVSVRTQRLAVVLRVPGSLGRIHIGQRVELRGSTLRSHGQRPPPRPPPPPPAPPSPPPPPPPPASPRASPRPSDPSAHPTAGSAPPPRSSRA